MPTSAESPSALSIAQVAALAGTGRHVIARLIREQKLPAFKIGNRTWRVRPEIVEQFLNGELT